MLVAKDTIYMSEGRQTAFDDLLFEICDELQLSPSRHKLAEQRYRTIGEMLASPGSPFAEDDPTMYPQGSMRLGTTVKPIDGRLIWTLCCSCQSPLISSIQWTFSISSLVSLGAVIVTGT